MRKFIFLILLITMPFSVRATSVIDSLKRELAQTSVSTDSLDILYNIFDLSDANGQKEYFGIIFNLAKRLGNDAACNDMIRNYTEGYTGTEEELTRLIGLAEELTPSTDRSETLTMLHIRRAAAIARKTSPIERRELLHHTLQSYTNATVDNVYRKVELLFSVCVILGSDTKGSLLSEYYDQLRELVRTLPPSSSSALRRAFFEQAARAYTYNFDYVKAVAADKMLLSLLNRQERKHWSEGRKYFNLNFNRYDTYRRLLSNSVALTNDEIESYYNAIKEIAAHDKAISDDLEDNERVYIYYNMAIHNYSVALPIIKRQLKNNPIARYRRYYLKAAIEASRALNDKETLMEASLAYNDILDELLNNKNSERYRELEIVYSVTDLKSKNAELEVEKRETAIRNGRIAIIAIIVAMLLLAVFFILLLGGYRKSRLLTEELHKSNQLLTAERDTLKTTQDELIKARDEAKTADKQKTEFLYNMTHEVTAPLNAITEYTQLLMESLDDSKRQYMSKYCDIVSLNVDLMQTLVNDVLDIAAADKSQIVVKRKPYSLKMICAVSLDSVKNRLAKGVELIFENEKDQDRTIITDGPRVEQVLINLLTNAAKFTEEGSITLRYDYDIRTKRIIFSVTDTGIGIPRGKEEFIFGRFAKLSKFTQGMGLGLSICRMLADMLGAKVYVDAGYRKGAKFKFAIPTDSSEIKK
jgi:signal transduction histidine kinase